MKRLQRQRLLKDSDGYCKTCGSYILGMYSHLQSAKHIKNYKRQKRLLKLKALKKKLAIETSRELNNNMELVDSTSNIDIDTDNSSSSDCSNMYDCIDYFTDGDCLVIKWSIEARAIHQRRHLCSGMMVLNDTSWTMFMNADEDGITIGVNFVKGDLQPFVNLSLELEHDLKSVSITKHATKVFSKATPSFGWKFPLRLLSEELDFVDDMLRLTYKIHLLTLEDNATVQVESTSKAVKHASIESRLLRAWMLENFITDKAVEHLLHILTSPRFTAARLAPSVYLLKQCDPAFIPSMNLRKTTVDGHLIHYYSPVDIWRILLSDSQYVHNWKLYFEYNNGTIEHPCNTDGWKEIEDSLSHLSKSHKLLLPSFFLDEYLQHNTSQKYVNSILMTLSNASKDVQLQTDRKYLISSVPDSVDINSVIKKILLPSIMLLERGEITLYFAQTKRVEKFCGTIFSMLGDHMGQIAISGLKAATCQRPSRYFLTHLDDMEKVVPLTAKSARKNAKALWTSVECAPTAEERDNIKLENGLSEQPALLDLAIFPNDFYSRFGNCLLHNSVVGGNLARHLLYLGEKYGEQFRKGVNNTIANFKFPIGSEKIRSLYYDKVTRLPNGENQKEIKLSQYIGKHLEIVFSFIMIWIQKTKLVNDDDKRCLANHINLYYILKTTTKWKRMDLDPVNGSLIAKIREVKAAIVKSFPQDSYNWRTAKFESMDAWPKLIQFLGPPVFQSTDTWEATHLPNKADSMLSNHHAVEHDVLKKRTCQLLYKHHQIFNSEAAKADYQAIIEQKHILPRSKVFTFGAVSCALDKYRKEIQHVRQLIEFEEPPPTKAFICSGFEWNSVRVRIGQCFEFKSPLMPKAKLYGELIKVLKFETNEHLLLPWLRIALYRETSEDLIGNAVLEKNGNVVIPLGAGYSVARLVHLYNEDSVPKINKFAQL